MIKGKSSAKLSLPTEGTAKRFVYDYLYEKRGSPLSAEDGAALTDLTRSVSGHTNINSIVNELRDYWGCDIDRVGPRQYVLLGEWCGRVYLDYTGPAEERASRPSDAGDYIRGYSHA